MHASQMDKRHDPRILGPLDFTLAVVTGEGSSGPIPPQTKHSALDLSEGGIRFHDEQDLPENALLEIRLQPGKDKGPITRHGRIRWKYPLPDQGGFEVGIQFVGGSPADRHAWQDFVDDRLDRIGTPRERSGSAT